MELSKRWQRIFGVMVKTFAQEASKDPSTKVGCLIYRRNKSIASMGINGLPAHIPDDLEKLKDRDWKNARIIHAERNALAYCKDNSLEGYGAVITFFPCADCAYWLAKEGIKTVYYLKASKEAEERWAESINKARAVFDKYGIKYHEIEIND